MAKLRRKRKGGGRKRREGVARTASGRISCARGAVPVDLGTPQLQAHKLAVVNGAADATLSASLTGILFAHGVLSPRQRDAADRFRRARAAVFGVVLGDRDPNRPVVSEERAQQNERRYLRMTAKLTVEQQLAVVDLVLDLRPSWARRAVLGLPLVGEDELERRHLFDGLDVLAGDGAAEHPRGAVGAHPAAGARHRPAGASGRAGRRH
jgi:hypothetical protein